MGDRPVAADLGHDVWWIWDKTNRRRFVPRYTDPAPYILVAVTKHLVDIDDDTLGAARAELGTSTLKDTVNEALRRVASSRDQRVSRALDALAGADLGDREDAWR